MFMKPPLFKLAESKEQVGLGTSGHHNYKIWSRSSLITNFEYAVAPVVTVANVDTYQFEVEIPTVIPVKVSYPGLYRAPVEISTT